MGWCRVNRHRIKEGVIALKEKGIKMTNQRLAMIEFLAETDSFPTAEDIYQSLKSQLPQISYSTIYYNLKCLKDSGLIQELTGKSSSRYEWVTLPHYHVICKKCGTIRTFNYHKLLEVEDFARKMTGYSINRHHFEVYGICSNCQKKL